MDSRKIENLDKKIQILTNRKNLLIQKEKTRQRKLLNKQKIIVGAWLINQVKTYSDEKKNSLAEKIISTIPENRNHDIKAIKELFGMNLND
jgi:uncharacterized protein YutD